MAILACFICLRRKQEQATVRACEASHWPGRRAGKIVGVAVTTLSVWRIALPVALAIVAGLFLITVLLHQGQYVLSTISLFSVLAFVLVVWLGMLVIVSQRHWLPAWRENGYGICTGNASPELGRLSEDIFEGLTPWMHRVVQTAAGRGLHDKPLTFGDLWTAPGSSASTTTEADPNSPRSIELAMMASDINRNRMVQLPFLETPSPIYGAKKLLDDYFPTSVVKWMDEHPGDYDERIVHDEDVIRLPKAKDLPVVFTARLSLSFPVLLSAIKLLTPDFAKGKKPGNLIPPRPLWLSDGGLVSNFPFFL